MTRDKKRTPETRTIFNNYYDSDRFEGHGERNPVYLELNTTNAGGQHHAGISCVSE